LDSRRCQALESGEEFYLFITHYIMSKYHNQSFSVKQKDAKKQGMIEGLKMISDQ